MSELKEEIENVTAYAIFQAGFHFDDWGDELSSVVREKWNEWPDERERCARLARAALLASGLPAALERVKAAEVLIKTHAEQFEFYELQHRSKGTPEADAKAKVNRKLASDAREFLRSQP